MTEPPSRANVRSKSYGIAQATTECPVCGARVRVIALVLRPGHESLVPDSAEDDDACVWQAAPWNAFVFYVEHLSEGAARRLQAFSPNYRLSWCADSDPHWANRCDACGASFEDQELYCEPDGVFLPMSAEAAARIGVVWIDEVLEAAASGYVCEPAFFDSMTSD